MKTTFLLVALIPIFSSISHALSLVPFEEAIEGIDALIVGDFQKLTGKSISIIYKDGELTDEGEFVQIHIINAVAVVSLNEPVVSHNKTLNKDLLLSLLEVSDDNKSFYCDVYISAPTLTSLRKEETKLWLIEKDTMSGGFVANLLSSDYVETTEIISSVKSGTFADGSTVP